MNKFDDDDSVELDSVISDEKEKIIRSITSPCTIQKSNLSVVINHHIHNSPSEDKVEEDNTEISGMTQQIEQLQKEVFTGK